MPKILHPPPRKMTVQDWTNSYPEFANIFEDAYIEPFKNVLSQMKIGNYPYVPLFYLFMSKYANRIVIPEFTDEPLKNFSIVKGLKDIISLRSYSLKYKYDMLAKTMPDDFNDFMYNYKMERGYTKTKESEQGTIAHTGTDSSYTNINRTTENYSTTGESASPRLKDKQDTYTVPKGDINNKNNSVNMEYGHTITSTPGKQTDTFNQTARGYYNAGNKAKILEDIRKLLNYNILDEWLKDITPVICLDVYGRSKTTFPFNMDNYPNLEKESLS